MAGAGIDPLEKLGGREKKVADVLLVEGEIGVVARGEATLGVDPDFFIRTAQRGKVILVAVQHRLTNNGDQVLFFHMRHPSRVSA